MVEPVGINPDAFEPGYVEDNLYWASRQEARKALTVFGQDDFRPRREASLSVGLAAEYLIGSAVAALHPALLADAQSAPSVVALLRSGRHAPAIDLALLRTASLERKVALLHAAHPNLSISNEVRTIMTARNAAAHVALASDAVLADSVVTLVSVVDALHVVLPYRNVNDYWGDNLRLVVVEMRDARSTAIKQRVAAKVASALEQLERILVGLDANGRSRTMASLEQRGHRVLAGDVDKPWECPACHSQGEVSYIKEKSVDPRFEPEYDRNGEVEDVYAIVDVTGVPVQFECPVCGIVLEGDELKLFPPMDEEVQLEDEVADPTEFASGDWDDY